jgi:hypothetical protein
MSTRVWSPKAGGIPYTVVVRWNPWTFAGELVVDGKIIRTWGVRMAAPDINFKIEGHSASVRKTPLGFDLYIDEQKIRSKEQQ